MVENYFKCMKMGKGKKLRSKITRFIKYRYSLIGTPQALIYETPVDSDEDHIEELSVAAENAV